VTVTAALSISPTTASVAPGGGASFTASGGDGSHTFSLFANNSGGGIDAITGAYTAGSTGGVIDTVRVTDGLGATADATVTVTVTVINVVVTTPSGSNGYSTQGGPAGNKHLLVTITVENEVGIPIEGALVTATISGPKSSTGTQVTDALGQVVFKITNAPPGNYTTLVNDVSGNGLVWNGETPPNNFIKQ
jgi:hypothetical protein